MHIEDLEGYHFYASSKNVVAESGVATALTVPDRPSFTAEGSPTVVGGELVFDGTNDRYVAPGGPVDSKTLTPVRFIPVPDASGGATGQGFTCTGLAFHPYGVPYIGNDGRTQEYDGSPHLSSIVKLSPDFAFKIGELTAATMGLSPVGSIQGVAYVGPESVEGVTHDIIAFAHLGDMKVHYIKDLGSMQYHGVMPGAAISGLNGLAYDPVNNQMICLTTAGVATWRSRADGSVQRTVQLTGNADQIYYDSVRDWIWYTTGSNGMNGQVRARPMTDLSKDVLTYTITGAKAIEGVVVKNGKIWLTNDQYYHPSSPAVNSLIEVDLPEIDLDAEDPWPSGSSNVQYFGVIRVPNPSAQSVPVAMIGDALAASSGHTGVFSPTGTSLQLLANRIAGTWTVPNLSTEVMFYGHIDLDTDTAELWLNGVSQGAKPMTGSGTTTPNLTAPGSVTLGYQVTGTVRRWFRGNIKAIGATMDGLADRQLVEGLIAWDTGRQDLLPEDHPHKLADPSIEIVEDGEVVAVFTANIFVRARAYLTLQGRSSNWEEALQEELEAQGYTGTVAQMLTQKAQAEGYTTVTDMMIDTHIIPRQD